MRKLLFVALLAIVTLLLLFMPPGAISLATLQLWQAKLLLWHSLHPLLAALVFFGCYVLVATLSLPGATLLTLLGGALFGLVQGTLLVAFGATCGATYAMLLSRYLLRDWVQKRFARMMTTVNKGMEKDGTGYLFALRLTPVFPFFLVNLLMGLTPVSVGRYFAVSFVGMLPAIVVYLNAGKELSRLRSLADILSPGMIVTFALIGFLPLLSRWIIRFTLSRRVDKR